MKIKLTAILAATFLFAGIAGANSIKSRVGLMVGYDTVRMAELNESIGDLTMLILGQEAKPIKAMAGLGLDAGMAVSENVILGARVGVMKTQVTSVELVVPLIASAKVEASGAAVPVMGGFRYMIPIDDNMWAGFGAYAGLAKLTANMTTTSETLGVTQTSKLDYEGSAPVIEGLLCFDYRITESISLGGELGYMSMKADSIGAIKDYDFDGDGIIDVVKGEKAKNAAGEDSAMDLSGVAIALSLNYLF